jgi:hypothetical protein
VKQLLSRINDPLGQSDSNFALEKLIALILRNIGYIGAGNQVVNAALIFAKNEANVDNAVEGANVRDGSDESVDESS